MKRYIRIALVLLIALITTTALVLIVEAQSPMPPQPQNVMLTSPDGQTTIILSFDASQWSVTLSFTTPQTTPARFTLVSPVFVVAAQPLDQFIAPMTVTVHYAPPPELNESELTLVYNDTTTEKWHRLSTKVDIVQHVATATTNQHGRFALAWLQTITALPASAIIVDDLDPSGFTRYGSLYWHSEYTTTVNRYWADHMFWTNNMTPGLTYTENAAKWIPALTPGPHQVYAFIPWNNATATQARYQVVHDGQTTMYTVNQLSYEAEWVSLGTYNFGSEPARNYVWLDDLADQVFPIRRIGFDAMGFVPPFKIYSPLVLKNWPPKKEYTGIHLGNHEEKDKDWTRDMLKPLIGDEGGIWPNVIVVQSKQIWNVWRPEPPDEHCEVAGADVRADRTETHKYLKQAAERGATIIIRIAPAPGNFQESIQPGWPQQVLTRTLITQPGVTPEGRNYCNRQWELFRAVDDVVKEMDAIHDRNQINGWPENSYYFVPANEPNVEWYGDATKPSLNQPAAWQAMDGYFTALIDYARREYPELQILTPPMAQGRYAEGIDWMNAEDPCKEQSINGQTGYDLMPGTYGRQANSYHGYSWHNYYILGWEKFGLCAEEAFHVSHYFPYTMTVAIVSGQPGFIIEADLCSWLNDGMGQCYNTNPLHGKEISPTVTQQSLRQFFRSEHNFMAQAVSLWLWNNDEASRSEYDWHEAYNEQTSTLYDWFTQWWKGPEK